MFLLFLRVYLIFFCVAAEYVPDFDVTNGELIELANEFYDHDVNAAVGDQVKVDYQGHTNTNERADHASSKFFSHVDESLFDRPTYRKLMAMYDNYNRQSGVAEPQVTQSEERREINDFLDSVMETGIWKTLYEFLHERGHPYASDMSTFRERIRHIWFDHYSRARGVADSSGFEHVFLGESKNGVSGLHSWIRLYTLEKTPREDFDYKGFVVQRGQVVAVIKYNWRGDDKKTGALLIGTSPEFDMALFTVCFLSRRGSRTCDVELNGCPVSITSYDLQQNGEVFIGSVFPSAGKMTDACRRNNS